jgi:predicted transcriptional regulator
MSSTDPSISTNFVELTADLVSAYVSNNSVQRGELPAVIEAVHTALQGLVAPKQPEQERPEPAVPIRRSITPDYLISLEDGKRYKSLKRHLAGRGLTPDTYRAKWGLPSDYPMVAANYAKRRSELAKSMGLGQIRRKGAPSLTVVDASSQDEAPAKGRRRAAAKQASGGESTSSTPARATRGRKKAGPAA